MRFKYVLFIYLLLTFPKLSIATIIHIPDDYPTIQQGVTSSSIGDTVLIHPGIYTESISFPQHNLTLASLFLTTDDSSYISQTIIDGNSSSSVITLGYGIDRTSLIMGLTIQNGFAVEGAGINCESGSPILRDIIVRDCVASNGGGGLNIFGGSPLLIHCQILSNHAENYGGGISADMAEPEFYNCVFADNSTNGAGGAVSNYTHTYAYFSNCVVYRNWADDVGGIWNGWSFPTIKNSILWDNENGQLNGDDTLATYSVIQYGWPGIGNIDMDPMFIDPENGNFHLQAGSPCIDSGDPDSPLDPDSTRADMGCYYFNQMSSVDETDTYLPDQITLYQNYPNPFNASTLISYELASQSEVTIEIYDLLSRKVTTVQVGVQSAGKHQVIWNAGKVSSGVYFFKFQTEDYSESRKMLLVK